MRTAPAIRPRCILLLLCLAFLHTAAPAQEGVRLERPEPIMLDPATGGGSGLIVLTNTSGKAQEVLLRAGTWKNTATGQETGASVTFSGVNDSGGDNTPGSPDFRSSVLPDRPLPVRVEISGLNAAGEVAASVLNNGVPMNESLRAINYRFPFSVNVAPESRTLRLAPDIQSQVVLVNEDEAPYPVEWRLLVKGEGADFTKESLPAKGSKPLPFTPQDSIFSGVKISSIFREETVDAMLEIRPRLREGLDNRFLPVKVIPLKARLGYWSPLPQQLAGMAVILTVLFAGGITSLLLSHFLPNLLRRRDLKDRLQAVDSSAGGVSDRIDSRLRVLMRVERRRLKELLKSVPVTSPDMNRLFTHCEQGIGLLESRVSLIEELDGVYDRLAAAQSQCPPPSLKARVEQLLGKAAALLSEPNPQESEFQVARTLVSDARAGAEQLTLGNEDFKKDLSRRLAELSADIYPSGPGPLTGKLADLFAKLPGPFEILRKYNGREIPLDMLSVIDVNLSALSMLRDYALIYDGTKIQPVRDKLDAHEGELLGQLSLQSWGSVRNGRRLLRQMQEGIYTSDVLDAIRSGGVTMEVSPQLLRPFGPARFSVRFLRSEIDGSAARDQFQCEWVFDERYEERGWDITHYFAAARTYKVSAWFIAPDGQVVTAAGGSEKAQVERHIPVLEDRSGGKRDRLIAEGVRLMIALFIALFGLITGAQDQLSRMDFIPGIITVFLLGFSADAIKNLLTQRAQPPT